MDNLLAGTLISLFVEFQCRIIVQRRCRSSCLSVIDIPLQAERHSGRQQQLFAFPPESAFTFRPEYCSDSQRNGVRLQTGIAFIFDRIPHHTPCTRNDADVHIARGQLSAWPHQSMCPNKI
jgi:hypothetical protein